MSFLLSRLETQVQQEVHLLRGVWGDFDCMKGELQRISSFLRVADTMEENEDEIKTWVEQVRDVVYDTEDVLKEFMIHIIHGHADGFHGFLRKIFCCIKNRKIRHQIASEMKRITSKVRDISEGHQRYCYNLNISGQGSGTTAENDTWYYPRGDALLLEEDELVGIEEPKRQLIGWLFHGDDPSLKVVSVVGMGGPGKATLVKKVYDDSDVKLHFQAHTWITVLETLDLKHTHVTKLPVEILKLQQLRHLLVYCYEIESYTPFHSKSGLGALAGIASLQSLQKLCFVKANKGGGVIVKELRSLNQLRS